MWIIYKYKLDHNSKLMHVTQNWKGFYVNARETEERTGVSLALPVVILVSRVRMTAEEREENLQGAASAL